MAVKLQLNLYAKKFQKVDKKLKNMIYHSSIVRKAMLIFLKGSCIMVNKIEISHVDKFYGRKKALKDVTLTINQGMFGLLGRNGAGKTT